QAQPTEQMSGNRAVTGLASVSTNSSSRPRASVSAWILVANPPRERPIQRSGRVFPSVRSAATKGLARGSAANEDSHRRGLDADERAGMNSADHKFPTI